MSNTSIIRVQSSEGTKRINISSQDTLKSLYDKTADIFAFSSPEQFTLYKEQNKKSPLRRTKIPIDLRHGDLIYLISEQQDTSSTKSTAQLDFVSKLINLEEDDVDKQLDQIDGKISREKDPQLCHHGKHGKCLHCIPIEPYDEEYLKNHNPPIKHMSFQSYLRKLQNLATSDKYSALKNISCSIKEKCSSGHAPWPKGICTTCQPSPITLMRQTYRHVDNIMFENGNIVDRFLNYWRSFGHQRVGFLYGRYEMYDGVPLGIRAIVATIYEPPQDTSKDEVHLNLPDPHEAIVEKIAHRLGLRRIGWIFTDLIPNNKRIGTGPVIHHRGNANTCFLTAQECIMSGWLQNKHLNTCKYSPDGYFGSKFVTVVVTGDASGQIHFEGYQVSNQCMGLVKSEILLPTYDASELGYIKETSSEQYVPDVYYKEKDSYNNEIMKIARPLPVDYLIIDIPTGFPSSDSQIQSTFNDTCSIIKTPFCIENRTKTGELQDMDTFTLYLQQFFEPNAIRSRSKSYKITDILGDFHVLSYLAINDIVPFPMNKLNTLLDSLRTHDIDGVEKWMNNEHWQTLLQLLQINCYNTNATDGSSSNTALPSHDTILSLSFNQDCTSLAMGTQNSYYLFTIIQENQINDTNNCEIQPYTNMSQLPYDSVHIIERLYSSSLLALVSKQSPRKLKLCHFKNGTEICSYTFANNILAVKLNRWKLVVCLEESIYIHNMRDMKVIHTIRDVSSNPDGLCALSSNENHPFLAYPGSSITGEIQLFDTTNLKPGIIISAHESPLAAMAFDTTGTRIATASNKGTVIRIHNIIDGSRLFEFRRGVRRVATIYSLAFSSDSMFLAASSNTGTIHIFRLIDQKEKSTQETSSWMSSFSRMLGDVAYYLPKQTSEVLTQDRAFATVHLSSGGIKSTIALTSLNNTLKLFVADFDGIVYVYEVNVTEGGECRQVNQFLLQMSCNNFNNDSTRKYPPNLLRNENNTVPLTNTTHLVDQTYDTAIDEQDKFPLPSIQGDDE
ncbi:hypothetical protein I4U23_029252 [Adineta vaga]|nr:hypothetical protein I4U23_029252 [Adineta vaga]